MSMDLILLAQQAAIGAALGAIGQLARVMIGLNKTLGSDAALGPAPFVMLRFVVTMAIGALAGGVGGLMLLDASKPLSAEMALGLIALGYAGTDVIEGLVQRYLPAAPQAPAVPAA